EASWSLGPVYFVSEFKFAKMLGHINHGRSESSDGLITASPLPAHPACCQSLSIRRPYPENEEIFAATVTLKS
ncbi:unnamed protein product, partial [Ilex paraguariensis]